MLDVCVINEHSRLLLYDVSDGAIITITYMVTLRTPCTTILRKPNDGNGDQKQTLAEWVEDEEGECTVNDL